MRKQGYLHGYSHDEHTRLHAQARVFAPVLHRELLFPRGTRLLEVGCGAGAQTTILLERNPALHVTAVDLSAEQLAAAGRHFRSRPAGKRVTLVQANATALPFAHAEFDAALSVWFLEHVPQPLAILREIRRVLRPGGLLHVREVLNHSFMVFPESPAVREYWDAYNQLQRDLGGNPNVGIELPNLLQSAGFGKIELWREDITYDITSPKLRQLWLTYWRDLLLSGAPALRQHRRAAPTLIAAMKREFAALQRNPHSVFHFTPVFGSAAK